MRIRDIEVIELRVPGLTDQLFDGSYNDCVVLVHTDTGLTGIAEVDSVPAVTRAIVEAQHSHRNAMGLREVLIDEDTGDIEALWVRMYDATAYYGRRGAVIHAVSAIGPRSPFVAPALCETANDSGYGWQQIRSGETTCTLWLRAHLLPECTVSVTADAPISN